MMFPSKAYGGSILVDQWMVFLCKYEHGGGRFVPIIQVECMAVGMGETILNPHILYSHRGLI